MQTCRAVTIHSGNVQLFFSGSGFLWSSDRQDLLFTLIMDKMSLAFLSHSFSLTDGCWYYWKTKLIGIWSSDVHRSWWTVGKYWLQELRWFPVHYALLGILNLGEYRQPAASLNMNNCNTAAKKGGNHWEK